MSAQQAYHWKKGERDRQNAVLKSEETETKTYAVQGGEERKGQNNA